MLIITRILPVIACSTKSLLSSDGQLKLRLLTGLVNYQSALIINQPVNNLTVSQPTLMVCLFCLPHLITIFRLLTNAISPSNLTLTEPKYTDVLNLKLTLICAEPQSCGVLNLKLK